MISFRSFCSIALVLFASGAAGCKQDPPTPQPEAVSSAASAKGKANLKTPVSALPKVDPQTMKEYRVDVCYFGTLTLRQARDAYFASLGKDEPSEKKIPSFGNAEEAKPGAAAAAKPASSAAAKPASSAAAKPGAAAVAAKPAASAGKSASPLAMDLPSAPRADMPPIPRLDDRKPFNFPLRAPHERNARACTVAVSLKEPAMPELDAILSEYAPYAVELAKNIAAATNYYQREEYKKDKLEKGKELHKQLVAGFEKLDAMSEKLGVAVNAWHKGHLPALASADEGQKGALTAAEDARALMLGLIAKGVDVAAAKAALEKLVSSTEALKTFGTAHPTDPWGKIMSPAFDAFVRAVKEAEPKLTDKGITDPSLFLPVVTSFVSLIEAKHRAHNRALIAKGQAAQAASAAADKPADAPVEK